MKKGKLSPLLVAGLILILCGLCLALFFGIRTYVGTQSRQKALERMDELLPEKTQGVPGMYPDSTMPALEIAGTDYVAVLEVPTFDVRLPVAAQWDSGKLYRGPARFSGSAYDSTLVIGGADQAQQLGFCDKIEHGTPITVTDMIGATFTYYVTHVDRAKHAESPWLMQDEYHLTLFCHDVNSMEYIAVRCTLADR